MSWGAAVERKDPSFDSPALSPNPVYQANLPSPIQSMQTDPVAQFVMDCLGAATTARQPYATNWDYYYRLYRGQQWPNRQLLRSADWMAYLVVNYLFAIIDSQRATLLDSHPKVVIHPNTPVQQPYARIRQYGMDSVWKRSRAARMYRMVLLSALIYGTGIGKWYWDPEINDVRCKEVPVEQFFPDPEATTLNDAEYTIEVRPVPISYLKRHYGDVAWDVRADAGYQGSYSQRRSDQVIPSSGWDRNTPFRWVSPSGDNPLVADQTEFSNPPFRPAYTRENWATLIEMWVKDRSTEVKTLSVQSLDPQTNQWVTTNYSMKKKKYPYGRVIHVAGGKVLEDGPSPYILPPGMAGPYVRVVDNELPSEFWGFGECELLKDLQLELNKRRSQLVNHASLMGNAIWIISKDSDIDEDMINNRPGQIIWKNPGSEVRRESPPQMPNWILQTIQMAVNDMKEISGVGNMPGGAAPKGARSGSAAEAMQGIATTRVRSKGHNLEEGIEDGARIALCMMEQFYTTARYFRIVGNMGDVQCVPYDGKNFHGDWDVSMEIGSTMPMQKQALAAKAVEFRKLGVIDNRAVLEANDFPGTEDILKRMGDQSVAGNVNMHYPGFPGTPDPDRSDVSGYAASVRHQVPLAPPMQPIQPIQPQGGKGGGGSPPHKNSPPPGGPSGGGGGKRK